MAMSTDSTSNGSNSPTDIEEIVAKRTEEGGRVYYLVRDIMGTYSWEQLSSLDSASLLIETFEFAARQPSSKANGWKNIVIEHPKIIRFTICSDKLFMTQSTRELSISSEQDSSSEESNNNDSDSDKSDGNTSDDDDSDDDKPILSLRKHKLSNSKGNQQKQRRPTKIIIKDNDSNSDMDIRSKDNSQYGNSNSNSDIDKDKPSKVVQPVWSNKLNTQKRMLGQRTVSPVRGQNTPTKTSWVCPDLSSEEEEEENNGKRMLNNTPTTPTINESPLTTLKDTPPLKQCFICSIAINTELDNQSTSKPSAAAHLKPVINCRRCHRSAHKICFPSKFFPPNQQWECNDCLKCPWTPERIITSRSRSSQATPHFNDNTFVPYPLRDYCIKFQHKSYRDIVWVSFSWISAISPLLLQQYEASSVSGTLLPLRQSVSIAWTMVESIICIRWQPNALPLHVMPLLRRQKAKIVRNKYTLLNAIIIEALDTAVVASLMAHISKVYIQWQELPANEGTWELPLKENDISYSEYIRALQFYLYTLLMTITPESLSNPQSSLSLDDNNKSINTSDSRLQLLCSRFSLKPYQQIGVNWLYTQWQRSFSINTEKDSSLSWCWLNDEHGLGRRVQVICFLNYIIEQDQYTNYPSLIIVHESMIFHWKALLSTWDTLRVITLTYAGVTIRP
ncbi:hypothetical protein BDF19DRAFT_282692 [Syncephalis fuscata]|nr:hypothetical protein BDF19DRAFT_282692 [Syncephalis fuscata]